MFDLASVISKITFHPPIQGAANMLCVPPCPWPQIIDPGKALDQSQSISLFFFFLTGNKERKLMVVEAESGMRVLADSSPCFHWSLKSSDIAVVLSDISK